MQPHATNETSMSFVSTLNQIQFPICTSIVSGYSNGSSYTKFYILRQKASNHLIFLLAQRLPLWCILGQMLPLQKSSILERRLRLQKCFSGPHNSEKKSQSCARSLYSDASHLKYDTNYNYIMSTTSSSITLNKGATILADLVARTFL